MATYRWHTTAVPDDLDVRQVYGFLFNTDGAILLRVDGAKYSLPGGRPEPGETHYADTLRREAYEEVTAHIADIHYLGYQCVHEDDGGPSYAQVRMIARLTALEDPRPDPDTGRTYGREFAFPDRAGHLLDWGPTGHQQVTDAAAAATNLLDHFTR